MIKKTCFLDIETDDFRGSLSTLWCAVLKCDRGVRVFHDATETLDALEEYDEIVGHNAIQFDVPALFDLAGERRPHLMTRIYDTLVVSRVLWPDRETHPAGGNSLAAWGSYLGFPKGDHTDFSCYSPQMLEYCKRDVDLTEKLYEMLRSMHKETDEFVRLELSVARIIERQWTNGFGFDVKGAEALKAELLCKIADVEAELQKAFPPRIMEMKTKTKEIPFNPGSRDQIASRLITKYKWRPRETTPTGKPKIDETILEELPYPEAKLLIDYFTLTKRMSQLEQWFQFSMEGVIRGGVNTNGALTGRMTHSEPNMAQVPRCSSPYGHECRALFRPTTPGYVQVGIDASGLELRMLGHYLARYDGGAYATVVCTGDIHTHNQKAVGLPTRDDAKTFIYATLYGAGDAKIGKIVGGGAAEGARLKERFRKSIPAYAKLSKDITMSITKRGYLRGLDGRPLPIRSDHAALNTLLQSAGAVVMKRALVILDGFITERGIDARFMANVHDEWQIEAPAERAEEVGKLAVVAIEAAGEELLCPLTGEFRVGSNWAETH